MSTVKQINQILEEEKALKLITEAYGEVAGNKLKKIRNEIEQTRVFFVEISKVFSQVKKIASNKGILTTPKTLPTAEILITSNYRFYGALENDLIRFFIASSKEAGSQRFFIGKTAQDFFKNRNSKSGDKFIKFKKDLPSYEELKGLTAELTPYKKILVYYPRFQSVLKQKSSVVDITQTPSPANVAPEETENINFIFEPELDKILKFFDTQITGVLIQQVFLEAELARTGARLVSMDEAQQKADEAIKNQDKELKLAERALENGRLLETTSSIAGFRKAHNNAR
jgi:ATP synthase F1 gamma subunit